MLNRYVFVSCDVVRHTRESSDVQREAVTGINKVVYETLLLSRDTGIVWASGGDGGHVAFPVESPMAVALEVIVKLKQWSRSTRVKLRVSACDGLAEAILGADDRTQLVGHGINLAARLIEFSSETRVVVSCTTRDLLWHGAPSAIRFHEERTVQPSDFPQLRVCLVSAEGVFASSWKDALPESDRARLRSALEQKRPLDVIYHSKRLLQVDPRDKEALNALRTLAQQGELFVHGDSFTKDLFTDIEFGPLVIAAAGLVERRAGHVLCEQGDFGETMFLLLHGQLEGLRPATSTGELAPAFIVTPGALVGELAFALRQPRTATLRCLEDSALLSFHYSELERFIRDSSAREELHKALSRRLLLRIVECVWNRAPYLAPALRTDTEVPEQVPWVSLLPHTTLQTLPSSQNALHLEAEPRNQLELVILVSGSVSPHDRSEVLDARDYPVLRAWFPDENLLRADHFRPIEEVKLLRVSADGLRNLGHSVYLQVIESLRAHLGALPPPSQEVDTPVAAAPRRFHIALSFPGESRAFVAQVAACLAKRFGRDRIFYDADHEAELARPDLDTYLQHIYHDEAELIVVFLCADYSRKEWCGLEWRAVRDLIKRRSAAAVMPLRFDETQVPGLFSIDGYISLSGRSPESVADLISQRWTQNQAG